HHVGQYPLRQVHGRGDVEVDDVEFVVEVGVPGEVATGAAAGVQGHRVDRAAGRGDRLVQLLHALVSGQVGLYRLDRRAGVAAQVGRGLVDLVAVGGDEQVVPVFGEL